MQPFNFCYLHNDGAPYIEECHSSYDEETEPVIYSNHGIDTIIKIPV